MDDYISRKAIMDAYEEEQRKNGPWRFEAIIESVPAADVRPVVRGHWEIVTGSNGKEYMVCSECRVTQTLTGTFSYCPSCGADMREEKP